MDTTISAPFPKAQELSSLTSICILLGQLFGHNRTRVSRNNGSARKKWRLYRRISVGRLSDDDIRFELPQLPDKVDHVRSGLGLRTGALLDVEIDAVDVVLVEPGRDLLSHGLGGRLAGQPVPRVVQEAANANKKDTLMAAKESQQELVLKNTMDSFLTGKTKNKREFLSSNTIFA